MEENHEERPSIGFWDKTVLQTIVDLGSCASEDRILKKLQVAGHKSLQQQSLLLPLQRLEAKGYLTSEWKFQEKLGIRVRFWTVIE